MRAVEDRDERTGPPCVQVELLSASECERVVAALDALRPRWTARGPGFWSLGAAAYLDAVPPGDPTAYQRLAAEVNPVLRAEFGWCLERVRGALRELLGGGVALSTELALPGFHVFVDGPVAGTRDDRFHLDMQHRHVGLVAGPGTRTTSFTLPVELPAAGAGLEFCRPTRSNKRGEVCAVPYRPGRLTVHSGRVLHRRARVAHRAGARRITLQGHGLEVGEEPWLLYW